MATKLKNIFESARTIIQNKLRRTGSPDTSQLIFDSQVTMCRAQSVLALLDERQQLMEDAMDVFTELSELVLTAKKMNLLQESKMNSKEQNEGQENRRKEEKMATSGAEL